MVSQVISGAQRRVTTARERGAALLRGLRRRWEWVDHLALAVQRYQDRRGDRLAAALTYFAFLAFFPLLALAYALLGYAAGFSDTAREYLEEAIASLLPGLADQLPVEQIAQAKTTAGVVGLAALLLVGLRWVATLRTSLRELWGLEPSGGGNAVLVRLKDLGVLAFLGAMLLLTVAVSTVTTSATGAVLGAVGLDDVPGMGTLLRLLSLSAAMACNTLIFLVLFTVLPGDAAPWRRALPGALVGAAGFEVLKLAGTALVASITDNPVYASFAIVVGLLVWIDLASRYLLFAAAWTATGRAAGRSGS